MKEAYDNGKLIYLENTIHMGVARRCDFPNDARWWQPIVWTEVRRGVSTIVIRTMGERRD
jgi:hypothetical protein